MHIYFLKNERILYRLQNNFDSLVNKAQKNLPIAKNKKEEVQNVGFSIEEYMQIQVFLFDKFLYISPHSNSKIIIKFRN